MKLPADKKEAIEFIRQCNEAVNTCLEQENVSALKETFDIRNQLIEVFFKRFSSQLTNKDMDFFRALKLKDAQILIAMKGIRNKVLSESSTLKKNKQGIRSYSSISKK